MVAVPVVIVLLLLLWLVFIVFFKPRMDHFEVLFPEGLALTWDLVVVVGTFAVTVFLWLMEPVFGIPSAVVAMLPILVFTVFGIIDREDLKRIEWHVLILIAGGLTLGVAMKRTGLSDVLVGDLSLIPVPGVLMLALLAIISVVVSNFMSNTAAANLMIPIVTSMGMFSPVLGAFVIAMSCSLAMSLPISTPPNAIAFATQVVDTKDLAGYGSIISAIGMVVLLLVLFLARGLLPS